MIRARIVTKFGNTKNFVEELYLPDRPLVGSVISERYRIVSISSPVAIGNNLSASEPEIGIQIYVEEIVAGM